MMEGDGECRTTSKTCSPTEFKCDNNNCIPSSYKCDFDNDCHDNSDERDCVYSSCSTSHFKCPSGRCIPNSYKCDGDNDCGDGTDELGCTKNCSRGFFLCRNGRCIPQSWVCDTENDCHDMSDELNCQSNSTTIKPATTPLVCPTGYSRCNDGSKCIPSSFICNGRSDCKDSSDEPFGCHLQCRSDQFKCWYTNKCVQKSQVCDGRADCTDGTDEAGCTSSTSRPYTTVPTTTKCGFRCPDGRCILASQRCDGISDCPALISHISEDEKNCGKSSTPPPKCPKGYFKCLTDPGCLPMSAKCNKKRDCSDGSDEWNCPTSSGKILCDYYPFGFNCSDQYEPCINSEKRCDGTQDCIDSSDETSAVCKHAVRVKSLQANVEDSYVRLSWKSAENAANSVGYHVIYRSDAHSGEMDPVILAFQHDYLLKDLHGCTEYKLALGVKTKGLKKKDWLYAFTSVVTPVNEVLAKPSNLSFTQDLTRHGGFLSWIETKNCLLGPRSVRCVYLKNNQQVTKTFDARGSFAELVGIEEKTLYNCTVQIEVRHENTGETKVINSPSYKFTTKAFDDGKMKPQIGKQKRSKSTLVWAIPVALVVLILVVALVIMVTKYRSLQRSFMAFANRGYSRAEEEDEDVAVSFHQGEDAPMINRFSDDEPLVV